MKNLVILISGTGSNMAAIIQAARSQDWRRHLGVEVAAVVSNRPEAKGLAYAKAQGIPTEAVDHRQFATREAFESQLAAVVDRFEPRLVVLAGFMRVLTAEFVDRYAGRLVNIHPSLLPAFPGLKTHERAIEAGCRVSGATVHFVTAQLDHGPILAQAVVPLLASDTPETLAARVLAQEHLLYPRAIADIFRSETAAGEG
jgi:phosphoribosylglycinamide formyltransferase 1